MSNDSDKLRVKKVNFGIDLGTTTSIISHCEGNDTPIIPNLISNMNFTPSAVAIDEDGVVTVGESAKRLSLMDEENAVSEFKLKMGMPYKFTFKDSGREMLPEELSAEVLKDLKNSVKKQLNLDIRSAVITVPADFGPIRIDATRKAAELAGFEFAPILMEPVAAANAYANLSEDKGTWLIYDLGGGTFDVSVVRLTDDDFMNLSHSGDERLGGNLIDWDIVFNIFAKKVRDDLGLSDFNGKNKSKYKKEFAKLKGAAEEAKKDLSRLDKVKVIVESLLIHDNQLYDFKYSLTKDELSEIMKPYIKRTINHCNEALKKANLTESEVDYLILVGGSTISPIVRESLENEFDIPLKYDVDPTTVVARGAALYAGDIPVPGFCPPSLDQFGLKLNYEAIGPMDEEFYVSGEILSTEVDDFDGFSIEVINIKTKRSTGKILVEDDGSFEFDLIPEDEINKYSINLYDSDGNLVEIDKNSPNAIEYKVHKAPDVVLPHTIGLGLASDKLFILAKEGTPLPYSKMQPFKTTAEVTKGDKESYIIMPLYNGTAKVASNNEKIGELIITGDMVNKTLLKGSAVTANVHIDESRLMNFEVNVLDIGQKFSIKIYPEIDIPTLDEVVTKFNKAKNEYEDLKLKCANEEINDEIESYLNQIVDENIIENIERFIETSENDEDDLIQANKLINNFNEILNNIRSFFDDKEEFKNIKQLRDEIRDLVKEKGTREDEEEFEEISQEIDNAISNDDSMRIEQLKGMLFEIKFRLEDPCEQIKQAMIYLLFMADYQSGTDNIVNDLKRQGMEALNNDDCPAMANIAGNLIQFVEDPTTPIKIPGLE